MGVVLLDAMNKVCVWHWLHILTRCAVCLYARRQCECGESVNGFANRFRLIYLWNVWNKRKAFLNAVFLGRDKPSEKILMWSICIFCERVLKYQTPFDIAHDIKPYKIHKKTSRVLYIKVRTIAKCLTAKNPYLNQSWLLQLRFNQ